MLTQVPLVITAAKDAPAHMFWDIWGCPFNELMTSDVCNELIEQQQYTKLMVNSIQLHKQSLMINISLLKYINYTNIIRY